MKLLQKINPKVILCDIWGVIHNGDQLFDDVLNFLNYCKNNNIKVVLFSNAPRRSETVKNFLLNKFNLIEDLYYDLISSGEVFVQTIAKDFSKNAKCFYFGEDKDLAMIDEISAIKIDDINEAEFTLITGPYNNKNDNNVDDWLQKLKNRNIVAYCPNPDIKAIKGNTEVKCAGFIAQKYQNIGGKVVWCGKPYEEIYQYAVNKLKCSKDEMLAIGDSLDTDIAGANNFGIKSVLVLTGKDKIIYGSQYQPTFIINNMSFDH